jgi:hypothetical protein
MPLGPLGAGLAAMQRELIFAHTHACLDLGSPALDPAHLPGRPRQAVGRIVLGAVSDDQHFETPVQPTDPGPVGVPTMVTEPVSIESAVLLEATDKVPAIVPNPLQEPFGGIPGVKEDVLRTTAQMVAGLVLQL